MLLVDFPRGGQRISGRRSALGLFGGGLRHLFFGKHLPIILKLQSKLIRAADAAENTPRLAPAITLDPLRKEITSGSSKAVGELLKGQ